MERVNHAGLGLTPGQGQSPACSSAVIDPRRYFGCLGVWLRVPRLNHDIIPAAWFSIGQCLWWENGQYEATLSVLCSDRLGQGNVLWDNLCWNIWREDLPYINIT